MKRLIGQETLGDKAFGGMLRGGCWSQKDPDLAASLFERVIGTSEENSARWSLVELHWGGVDRWAGANLQRGLDHWLALNPNPTQRGAAIQATAVWLIERGKPRAVGDFMDMLEAKQKAENQSFTPDQRVFRGVCRLMADRHVPETWQKKIPSFLEPLRKSVISYLREPDGGNLTLNCGHLETQEKRLLHRVSLVPSGWGVVGQPYRMAFTPISRGRKWLVRELRPFFENRESPGKS